MHLAIIHKKYDVAFALLSVIISIPNQKIVNQYNKLKQVGRGKNNLGLVLIKENKRTLGRKNLTCIWPLNMYAKQNIKEKLIRIRHT